MATIKDVSQEAGLSIGTVSRILNNRGYISEEARKKVDLAMKKLNYQPNEVARSLSKKSSSLIGLVVPQLENPYFSVFISYVEQYAARRGYSILLFCSNGMEQKESEMLDVCRRNRVAGIILCSGRFSVATFGELDCPLVTMEREVENELASVGCDNYTGGVLAAQHLIDRGCHHVAYLSGLPASYMSRDKRAQGFSDVCRKNNTEHVEIPFSEELYRNTEYFDFLEEIFTIYSDIDGVFASNDIIAAQIIQRCAKHGINVPDDMKIVGFDDIPLARWTTPALTTIHQPLDRMAEATIQILLDAKTGAEIKKVVSLPVELVIRGTT